MKQTRLLMGMPITVEIIDQLATNDDINKIFEYFQYVDSTFSTYKTTSEISRINAGVLQPSEYSNDVKTVFELCEQTRQQTNGYFDIKNKEGKCDPSGLVKGWAINNAAALLRKHGFQQYYVEAGGDVQVRGKNGEGKNWRIGIQDPFGPADRIVKVLYLTDMGVATSGTYIRGQHIYNPKDRQKDITDIVSLTVIAANVYEADRFATAAFAMGRAGIQFIEQLPGFEGYMIDAHGIATMTTHFETYTREYV